MEAQHSQSESINNLPPNLEESMKNIAKNNGFITYEVFSKTISTNGSSYMGVLYEVNIKGKTAEGDKELDIFVKNIVQNEQLKIYSVSEVFRREEFVYKELSRIFTELQDEAKVPDNERFKMAKSYEECNSKSIILEHLGRRGFKINSRMETISIEYAKLCIQQLAKFHALSLVIQEKYPKYFNEKILTMKQPFCFEEDWYGFVKNMFHYSINCLDPDVKKKVEKSIWEIVENYPKYLNDTSGVNTICHGDYKHNNIMANEVNGEPSEVIPIDFQIMHCGCPVLDFLYFIFNGTDQEFRRIHLSNLKNLYYKSLAEFLEYFGMDIEKIFSRMEFERIFREKLDFGLMINVFYVPFLFAAEDDAPDVTNQSLTTLSFTVDKRFTERFRGIVDDFIDWGYL